LSTPPAWLTVDDVAAYLDIPAAAVPGDDNLELAVATIKRAIERRRSDLNVDGTFTPDDEVKGGAVVWAALFYQTRNAPSGFAGYGDDTMMFDALGARRAEVMRLVGWRRPVAT
jgi:hypothetical protein